MARIAIDLDDVVLDFRKGLLDAMYTEFGVQATREEFTEWDSPLMAPYTHVFKAAGYKTAWDWLRDRDWLWATFVAIPGAIGGVKRIRERGHYVELLTAKPEWAEWAVWRWLGRWRPSFNRVTIVSNKASKPQASDADVLVDDKTENIVKWVMSRPDRYGIIFDQPWNQDCLTDAWTDSEGHIHQTIYRARNWHDVVNIIEQPLAEEL